MMRSSCITLLSIVHLVSCRNVDWQSLPPPDNVESGMISQDNHEAGSQISFTDSKSQDSSSNNEMLDGLSDREPKFYSRVRATSIMPPTVPLTEHQKAYYLSQEKTQDQRSRKTQENFGSRHFDPASPPADWMSHFPDIGTQSFVPDSIEDLGFQQSPVSPMSVGHQSNRNNAHLMPSFEPPTPQRLSFDPNINQGRKQLILDVDQQTGHPDKSSFSAQAMGLGNPVLVQSQNDGLNHDPMNRVDSSQFVANMPQNQLHGPYQRFPAQSRYSPRPWFMPNRVNCRQVEKVVKVQQCEPYTVETCWEEAKQECSPQPVTTCTGMVDSRLEQVCFYVEDELCSLIETVESEKTEDSYQTQHCFFGNEAEVCGSSYEVQKLEMEDYGCTSVNVLNCRQESQFIHDVNCIESVEFDCKPDGYQPNTMLPAIRCTPNPTKNCYKIPRKVFTEVCEVVPTRHCEAFNKIQAIPVEKPTCKTYTRKSCDFKIETSPKISNNFKYEKVCRKKLREICEHVESSTIVPDCETSEKLSCKYVPHAHQCKYDPKHYCHLVDKVVEEEVCDTVFGYAQY